MSESENKENRRRKHSKIVEPNTTSNKKRRKLLKPSNGLSGINVSKQLYKKRNQSKVKKSHNTRTCLNQDSRFCGNGKPMPSLKELEKLYDDSEEDTNNDPLTKTHFPQKQSTENDLISITQNRDHCQKVQNLYEDNIFSPTTIKDCAMKMMHYLEEVMEYVVLKDDVSPPPCVVPQKNVKKSDIPYIDGCKERAQVECRPKNNFGKGDGNYGVKPYVTLSSDDELPSVNLGKSKNRTTISNSIFNSKSVEISQQLQLAEQHAEMLKSLLKTDYKEILATSTKDSMQKLLLQPVDQQRETIENFTTEQYNKKETINEVIVLSDDSNDSVETVCYFNKSECEFKNFGAFSPKPSTSSDQETILENDKNFEETLKLQAKYLATKNKDAVRSFMVYDSDKNNDHDKLKKSFSSDDNSINNDIYSSIDMSFPIQVDGEDYDDDNDYDKLLAENKAIIQKYNKQSSSHVRLSSGDNNQIIKNKAKDSDNKQLINTKSQNYYIIIRDFQNSILNNAQGAINNDNATNRDIQRQSTTETCNSNFISKLSNNATLSCQTRPLSKSYASNQPLQTSIINNSTLSFKHVLPSANNRNSGTFNDISTVLHTTRKRPRSKKITKNNKSYASNSLINARNNQSPLLNNNVSLPSEPSHMSSKDQNPLATTGLLRNIGECPICMEGLCEKQVASTICGHVFCLPCIKEALKVRGKKCPSCRKSLRGIGYHQLFL